MAPTIVTLLLSGLCLVGFGLSAPTTTPSLITTTDVVTGIRTSTENLDRIKRAHVVRFDTSKTELLFPDTAMQARKYTLDSTLDNLDSTDGNLDTVPVFSTSKSKNTIVDDATGDVMTLVKGDKFRPIWGRHHKTGNMRLGVRFKPCLAICILGLSLMMALLCVLWRASYPAEDLSLSDDPESSYAKDETELYADATLEKSVNGTD